MTSLLSAGFLALARLQTTPSSGPSTTAPTSSTSTTLANTAVTADYGEASSILVSLTVVLVLIFAALLAASVARHIIRTRADRTSQSFQLEDLFSPSDMQDMERRLGVQAAATSAQIDPALVDVLNQLVDMKATVVALRTDVVWTAEGGKQPMLIAVFNDTTTLRFAVDSYDVAAILDPARKPCLCSTGVSPDSNIVLFFETTSKKLSLEVTYVTEIQNY